MAHAAHTDRSPNLGPIIHAVRCKRKQYNRSKIVAAEGKVKVDQYGERESRVILWGLTVMYDSDPN